MEKVLSILQSIDPEHEKFEKLLLSVRRDGVPEMLDWLEKSDFFSAPASTRFHLSRSGGLLTHSLNVLHWFSVKNERLSLGLDVDSVVLVSLLHDICKVNTYVTFASTISGGAYGFNKHEGHGSRSLKLIDPWVQLLPLERQLILYHMGTYGVEYSPDRYHSVISENPLVAVFAITDHEVSIMEKGIEGAGKHE